MMLVTMTTQPNQSNCVLLQ